MTTVARLILLAATAVLLSGCSTIKVAYNQADHIVAWMADDYFDLTPEQKSAFKTHFDRFHAWHRSTQLSDYIGLLEATHRRVSAGATQADAEWFSEGLQTRLKVMVRYAYKDAAVLLAQLSDDQVRAARKEMDNRNRKYAKENGIGAPEDEQRRLRAKRQLERIEHWTGPLDSAQEAKVRAMSRALPLIAEQRYQERHRRQKEFLDLLQQRKNVDAFAPKLRDWMLDWDQTRAPGYQPQYTRFMQESARMYVAVLNSLTPEQRQHVLSVIARYQQSFRELAAQAPRQQAAHAP